MERDNELASLIFDMLLDYDTMFYGFFLSELNKGFSDRIPTACVAKHPSSTNIQLLFNPEFWDKIKASELTRRNNQRKFLMLHEICHVIYEHIQGAWDWLVTDKELGNAAMDMFINQNLQYKQDMPKYDEGENKDEYMGMLPDTFPDLKLNWGESTEYYYRELEKAKQKKKESGDNGKDSKAEGQPKGNGTGTSGDKKFDKYLESNEDIHVTWEDFTDGMTENEKKLLEKQLQAAMREAVEQTEKSRGTLPAHLKDAILNKLEIKLPVANWKSVLRQFAGNSQKMEQYRTRKRENYRFTDAPANKTKHKPTVAIAIDTSGSIGEHELEEFFNEVYHIWKTGVFVDLIHWDTEVHLVEEYKGQREVKRVACGGTYMSSAVQYLNDNRTKYDCGIILSDGYVETDVLSPKIPALLVISSNGTDQVNIQRCKKIKINNIKG